ALYVSMTFQSLFLQGGLGYTPLAAGAIGLPVAIMLTLLSTPAGQLAGRWGPRIFMTVGPLIMALGVLWLARIPADSAPWLADLARPDTLLPPADALLDVGIGISVFGLGLAAMVAPLTTALMSSVPVRNAGLGSAINNAISRAGSPLVFAVIFVAIVSSYYPALASMLPGVDLTDPAVREAVRPFSVGADLEPAVAEAAREAATGSFHLAMFVSAALLAVGAAINGFGIENPSVTRKSPAADPAPGVG
ncbi:MAG TPA: hypothetical protein VFV59_05880, partial [Candidatus Limnocylindria bacterium]|nr:hypothetical protein [Candidatus Limnocylindria bacterium]